jgi:competence ComEA-like helix-hairpin-helix protein
MKWPFFKSSKKSEQKPKTPTIVVAPRVDLSPIKSGFSTAVQSRLSSESQSPVTQPAATAENTIPLPLAPILSQLPAHLFVPGRETQLARLTLPVASELVLPQLASGRVTLRVADLLPLVPSDFLNQPLQHNSDHQTVVLPLDVVVSAIPPDAFAVSQEAVVDTDSPEFSNLPSLFDDALLQEPLAAAESEKPAEPAEPETAAEIIAPASDVVQPSTVTGLPNHVMVSLRSLVAVMPDRVFSCPRAELWDKTNLDCQVPLPLDPILPQLQSAHVTLDLKTIIDAMPPALFVKPLPQIAGESVPLPLEEIVPQLPQLAFTSQLAPAEEIEFAGTDIPDPFLERAAQPLEPEPAEPVAAAEPVNAPEPVAEQIVQPVELPAEALEDDGLAIFAEKLPAPVAQQTVEIESAQPVEPPQPVEPEPVEAAAQTEVPEPSEFVEETVAETAQEPVHTEVVEPAAAPIEPTPVFAETAPVKPAEPVEPVVTLPVEPEPVQAAVEPAVPATVEPVEVAAESVVETSEQPPAPVEAATVQYVEAPQPATAEAAEPTDENKFLVNLNRCTVEDLVRIEGVGPASARRIIEYRNARGRFRSVQELRQIPGVGRKTFRALVGSEPRTVNSLLGVPEDRDLSLREIVDLTCTLPGVEGCILALSDGLFLMGHLPQHIDQNTVSVFAPQIFKKISRYSRELNCGEVRRFTIFTDQHPMTIFHAGEVYLIVVHTARRYSKAALARCERISQEIARQCHQRVVV